MEIPCWTWPQEPVNRASPLPVCVGDGKVVGADLSEDMLRIAATKALQKGVSNFETVFCEAGNLPFPDNSFDAVSCRNGYMFFPDLMAVTRELHRVVKPGHRIAISVWGTPDHNPWVAAPMRVIDTNMDATGMLANVSMFRCAEAQMIADIFRSAGFKNVVENCGCRQSDLSKQRKCTGNLSRRLPHQ